MTKEDAVFPGASSFDNHRMPWISNPLLYSSNRLLSFPLWGRRVRRVLLLSVLPLAEIVRVVGRPFACLFLHFVVVGGGSGFVFG